MYIRYFVKNDFHKRNCYLKLELKEYDINIATELFDLLQYQVKRSLQVMISSVDVPKVIFLEKGGFHCIRKCYEVEVTVNELRDTEKIAEDKVEKYLRCKKGVSEYELCANFIYEYYMQTHEKINPLTVNYETFLTQLPDEVFFMLDNGKIEHVAFIQENEIAYVGTSNIAGFKDFVSYVVRKMFKEQEELFFECDDCDAAAMILMDLFEGEVNESYDTYIRICDGNLKE